MNLKSWLFFDTMITPRIIRIVYWILLFLTVVSGVFGIFINPVSIIVTIISIIFLRISCEVVILMFNIYQQIKKLLTIYLLKTPGDPGHSVRTSKTAFLSIQTDKTFGKGVRLHIVRFLPALFGSEKAPVTHDVNSAVEFPPANHNAGCTTVPGR